MSDCEQSAHVTLSGELSGQYLVDEVLEDGRIVLRPDTSAAAMRRRAGLEQVSDALYQSAFGQLASVPRLVRPAA